VDAKYRNSCSNHTRLTTTTVFFHLRTTTARTENTVLTAKVRELSAKVKELMIENQSLLAEVEMYRKDAALPNFSSLALGAAPGSMDMEDAGAAAGDDFVKSGNGVYPTDPAVTLKGLHDNANPLCCALHPADDSLLATGGANRELTLSQWGGALAPSPDAAEKVIAQAARIECPGPVICVAFSYDKVALPVVAAGCMDGAIVLAGFGGGVGGVGLQAKRLAPSVGELKCSRYIKGLAWSPTAPVLAAASADGTIVVLQVSNPEPTNNTVQVTVLQTLHLGGTPESICFSGDGAKLICYTRDTPLLSFFDLSDEFKQTKINLNKANATGGFEEHVSFAVMDMAISPNGKYLALATDTSRNIVIDAVTGRQLRNLYGHTNDGFSNPKIAWSSNSQYVFGNTQEGGSVCVWDVASSSIVTRLEGHGQPVRSLCASATSDTVVTTSFDKQTTVWLAAM
jgi:WD40 repeat protein